MEERRSRRIESFDPLLRDLVAWGIVVRGGTKTRPSWTLVEAAQRRLDELEPKTGPFDVDQLVYLDHLCADCRLRTPTRLRDGIYLCDACTERRATVDEVEIVPSKPTSRGIWHRNRRSAEGGGTLAG